VHLSVFTSGIVSGSLYALTALSFVVVYRASKVVNFALGGMGGLSAYVAFSLLGLHLPYWVAYLVAIAVGSAAGGLTDLLIVRPLARFPPLTISVSTFGLLLLLQGIIEWRWGTLIKALPVAFGNHAVFTIAGTTVTRNQVFVVVVFALLVTALALFVERTRVGLGMRATSAGPLTSSILGVDTRRMSLVSWVLGGAVGAVAALLATPVTYLDPTSFTQFNFLAFVAVVLGGLTSFRGVVIGGLLYGVGSDIFSTYGSGQLTATFTLVAAALILVFRPYGIFGTKENNVAEPVLTARRQVISTQRASNGPAAGPEASPGAGQAAAGGAPVAGGAVARGLQRWKLPPGGLIAVVLLVVIVPFVAPSDVQYLLPSVLATYLAVLGLNVLAGFSGQLSLGTGGFAAVGAYTAVCLNHSLHVAVPLAIAAGLVGGAVVGFVVAIPASRLGGHYLALLTLLFALAVPELVLRFGGLTGGTDGLPFVTPGWLSSWSSQYWTFLAVAVVATGATMLAARSRLGKRWNMVRDSETGARSIGLNPMFVKISAFCWGCGLAGLSGALSALSAQFVSPDVYDVWLSIYLVLAVIVGGLGSVTGSLLGAALITLVPFYTGNSFPPDIIYGVVLIVVFIVAPRGLAGLFGDLADQAVALSGRLRTRTGEQPPARAGADAAAAVAGADATPGGRPPGEHPVTVPAQVAASARPAAAGETGQTVNPQTVNPLLAVESLTVGYGSVEVLEAVSLTVCPGEAVALLGANGAGKSTLLRTVSGLISPSAGTIRWDGQPILGSRPFGIARLGLAHVPEGRGIFPDLTVEENLRLGLFGLNQRHADQDAVEVAYEWFPHLGDRRRQRAGTLSGGEQQMVAVGRALAARPRLLMLDEPSLGLAPVIVTQLFEGLTRATEAGIALLVVEQNSKIALNLASRGYVLSAGRIMTEGLSGNLLADGRVAAAYLGGS
jgi:ABC-type branched-subunit amino acid transport system ATPase component/ABC-type branched-subunit amino acid transport system permease subunit